MGCSHAKQVQEAKPAVGVCDSTCTAGEKSAVPSAGAAPLSSQVGSGPSDATTASSTPVVADSGTKSDSPHPPWTPAVDLAFGNSAPSNETSKTGVVEDLDFAVDDDLFGAIAGLRGNCEQQMWKPSKVSKTGTPGARSTGTASTVDDATCWCLSGHPLAFLGTSLRPKPAIYSEWFCDRPGCESGSQATPWVGRFNCGQCHYDLCGRCAHALRSDSSVGLDREETASHDPLLKTLDQYTDKTLNASRTNMSAVVVKGERAMPMWDFRRASDFADTLDLSTPREKDAADIVEDEENNLQGDEPLDVSHRTMSHMSEDSEVWRGIDDARAKSVVSISDSDASYELSRSRENDIKHPKNKHAADCDVPSQAWRMCA